MDPPTHGLPPEVIDAIRRGNPIEAIKLLRARGLGLAEAKAYIDAHVRGFATPTAAERATRALPPDAARALARGDKIEAIKLVRARRASASRKRRTGSTRRRRRRSSRPASHRARCRGTKAAGAGSSSPSCSWRQRTS
jgi:ribosomal protein L7/L12